MNPTYLNVNVTTEYGALVREIAWREQLSVSALIRRTLTASFPELAGVEQSIRPVRGRPRSKNMAESVTGDSAPDAKSV